MRYIIFLLLISFTDDTLAQTDMGITISSDNRESYTEEYIDPATNVIYTYDTQNGRAKVKQGDSWEPTDDGSNNGIVGIPGSPDAKDNIVILERFTINSKEFIVDKIGDYAFVDMANIKSVVIPPSIKSIGNFAFHGCISLSDLVLSEGLTSIGNNTFVGCGFTSLSLPSDLEVIGNMAFGFCDNLKSVFLPASIAKIGQTPFKGCKTLKNISIEEGNTVYDSRDNCNAIIETESNKLITGCKGTIIPPTVSSIGECAFQQCYGLEEIFLPKSITEIKGGAFYYCTDLEQISLPEGVEIIRANAFCKTGLKSVTIPSTVHIIETAAFYDSPLKDVTSLIEEPFNVNYPFSDSTYSQATLRVPYGTKAKYEATAGWNQFKNIEEFIPTSFNPIVSEAKFWQLYESGESTFSSTTTWRTVSIDGKDYQQILHFNGKTVPDTLYFRGDNTRIYRYDANAKTEYTAYDFGLSFGDKFTGNDGVKMTVDKTWYENVNGRSLKHLHLVNMDNPQMQDTWVEGYGSIYTGLLNPTDWQDGVVQQHLLFDSSGYINIINTENLKTRLLEREKIGEQIFDGNQPEKVISYSFDSNNLCLDGEMYLPASPCYAVCEVIGNTIDINLITIDDGAESSFTYKVHAVFPGFEAGTYTLTQNGEDPQTIICQPTSINYIKADSNNTSIFDLTGRRLNTVPEKGMYIKGGRKYLIKK